MRILLLITLLVSLCQIVYGQHITIAGRVTDEITGETLPGVIVTLADNKPIAVTDKNGIFNLTATKGASILIQIRYLGYAPVWHDLISTQDTFLKITLRQRESLDSIIVTDNHQSYTLGMLQLSIKQLQRLPRTFGEVDVLRAFQLMPGVQGGREGTSGLYVRGGSPDQNLVLLDDVPLYYVNHLGGFLSVFDATAIKKATLIKGGFPANYGGRLSSVVDVQMKSGDKSRSRKEVGIGLLSTKLSLEGPLGKKGTTTYMFSIRRCNFDLFTRLFSLLQNGGTQGGGYNFYDLYGKVTHVVNPKNTWDLSLYSGRDKMFGWQNLKAEDGSSYKYKDKMRWGNTMLSFRWNQIVHPKIQASYSAYFTRFFYDVHAQSEETEDGVLNKYNVRFDTRNQDLAVRTDWIWKAAPRHKVQAGLSYIYHEFNTGLLYDNVRQTAINTPSSLFSSGELKYYLMDDWQITESVLFQPGVHVNNYFAGRRDYLSVQPRAVLTYRSGTRTKLQASYTVMQQNEHLLSNFGAGLPTDVWVPSTSIVVPEQAQQVTAGYFQELNSLPVDISVELFYKQMSNLIEFREGVSFFASGGDWQNKVVQGGTGQAYGIEAMVRKQTGKITGWVAYTLGYNYRKFKELNNGNQFPYRYDRRHSVSIVGNYDLTKRIQLSATWVYASGDALTMPESKYPILDQNYYSYYDPLGWYASGQAHIYPSRNNFRAPAYHRLDLSMNFHKTLKKGERIWNISVYNVYNRQNPYYLYFGKDNGQTHLYQFTLFPVLPVFSYIRKW